MQATAHRVMCKGSGDGVALLPWRCAQCLSPESYSSDKAFEGELRTMGWKDESLARRDIGFLSRGR